MAPARKQELVAQPMPALVRRRLRALSQPKGAAPMRRSSPERLELWRCTQLRALLTESACERNHERATAAARAGRMTKHNFVGEVPFEAAVALVHLSSCIGCPGVRALARRAGVVEPARVVSAKATAVQSSQRARSPVAPA